MEPPTFETIEWAFDDETGIGTITLDRPDTLNALSKQSHADITAALDAFEELDRQRLYEDDDGVAVRVVVLEGAGDRAFCVGSDIDDFEQVKPGVFDFSEMYNDLEAFPAPTVAKIDGYCLGGGFELALACDFRLASDDSEFGFPEIELGIIPGDGGTQRLPELVGPSRTKELCITGERVPAPQASEEGLVDYVYPAADLDDETASFAERIAGQPPLAARAVKEVVNMSQETSLRVGRYYERRAGESLTQTADHEEGVRAFNEKREPEWQGK
jgi:enoyl-CoA hydratase/carnithine racemase